jgi:gag-polypeptide of LTR copia-type
MANYNNSQGPLTNLVLDGKNYIQWARVVKVGLGGRSKLEHITGLVEKPDGTISTEIDKNKDWIARDLCVMSWIFNTMEPKIYEIFAFSNTAKELWDSLFEMYGNSNKSS